MLFGESALIIFLIVFFGRRKTQIQSRGGVNRLIITFGVLAYILLMLSPFVVSIFFEGETEKFGRVLLWPFAGTALCLPIVLPLAVFLINEYAENVRQRRIRLSDDLRWPGPAEWLREHSPLVGAAMAVIVSVILYCFYS